MSDEADAPRSVTVRTELTPDWRETLTELHISIDEATAGRLRQVMAEHAERLSRAFLTHGILTINEARALEELPPIEETIVWGPFATDDLRQAEARGEALLREWLSPAQRESYDAHRHFEVTGSDTGRRYRIRPGDSFNVEELDEAGKISDSLCFAPQGWLVRGDVMLAQKIALENNEAATLKIANRRSGFATGGLFGGWVQSAELLRDIQLWPTGGTVRTGPEPIWIDVDAGETVHPRSWMAQWGRMGADLARAHRRQRTSARAGSTSPAARAMRR